MGGKLVAAFSFCALSHLLIQCVHGQWNLANLPVRHPLHSLRHTDILAERKFPFFKGNEEADFTRRRVLGTENWGRTYEKELRDADISSSLQHVEHQVGEHESGTSDAGANDTQPNGSTPVQGGKGDDEGSPGTNENGESNEGESPRSTDTKGIEVTNTTSEQENISENVQESHNGTSIHSNMTEATDPNVVSGNNDTNAFSAFKLIQMIESDSKSGSHDAFEMLPVFENGSLTGPFANGPKSTNIEYISSSETERWYMEKDYMDRIAFRFQYTPDSTDYKISKPTIATTSASGIEPVLQSFDTNLEAGDGSFSILYRCTENAQEESYISFHIQVTATHSIDTAWKKTCGHGRFKYIDLGFTSHNMLTVPFNNDGTYGKEERKSLEVGPLDESTELTMKLTEPAQSLDFKDPFVSSDSEKVSVSLRSTIAGDTVTVDASTKFSVIYSCRATTPAQITFTVAIPPWDNITTTWHKDCGGGHSQSLLVGTTGPGSFDVMHDGEVISNFKMNETSTISEVSGSIEEVPGNVDYKRFYITNSDDTSEIQLQTISMTMSNSSVVTTIVDTPFVSTASYISKGGAFIQRRATKSLYLHFICKEAGRSLILVTIPVLRYKNIEFGFMKKCFAPQIHRHSGFLTTAGSLLTAIFVLAVAGGCVWRIWLTRRSQVKYTAVPRKDSIIP